VIHLHRQFDASFGFLKISPEEKLQTQIDRRSINAVQRVLESKAVFGLMISKPLQHHIKTDSNRVQLRFLLA
jgi:hypothetical protein